MLRFRLLCALGAATASVAALAPVTASPTAAAPVTVASAITKTGCGGERPAKPGGGRYTCSFEDDFNGSALDRSKWVVQETAVTGISALGSGCYVDDPDNIRVGSGQLFLTARKEAAPFTCSGPFGSYTADRTAATIGSYGLFTQTYGRFEFRAKLPNTTIQGIHSALWLYPQKHTYGAWPSSGEIDVAEWFSGTPQKVYPSVHYAGEDTKLSSGYNCLVANSGTQFHRYAVEWTPTSMRFLYDNRVCFTHSWTPDAPLVAPQPFDQPFYVVLTQVFGGGWNSITPSTPTSATTTVDWVRVWK
ncbi:glycoside hydrolase family 16 protein [Nocardioides daeguensis]|uniref:Glycoside hydrolase family 16 protein n=1 Tax=Nocardioides daeguensis TaxID=908359 RepID=A0ABP6V823_9ACTN|nr:glycoside hydrolase family 16 protein [Nocardioides daeguensis]MBV6726397.1 glycoside hydrolase family 16 protein [Nocardioides daeguensis]MCR1772240.1 glycoside hydrolase family 16 protein [Nocardioides daeguensis]